MVLGATLVKLLCFERSNKGALFDEEFGKGHIRGLAKFVVQFTRFSSLNIFEAY